MNTPARLPSFVVALAAIAIPAVTLAQSPQAVPVEAEKLYEQAAAAMTKKDYATACPAFEQVIRMVPDGGGARLNLAECYEEWGKLGSALKQYSLAEVLARKDGRNDRLQVATKGAARVKPRVATVTITVSDEVRSAPDLVIKVDGEVLDEKQWGVPYPVDKGAHTVVASARGYEPQTVRVDIEKDGTSTATSIPKLEPAPEPVPEPSATAAPSASSTAPLVPETPVKSDGPVAPGTRTAVLIVGSTLAVGGVVAGGVALGISFAKADERKNASADPAGREAAKAAAMAEAQAQSTALWCFVGGGAAAAFTLIFGVATRPEAKPRVKAGAFVGPQGPSLWVEGNF